MTSPIQRIRINNLQYNPNRDPQVYRRLANQPFRIEADIAGNGQANVRLEVDDQIKEASVSLPGKFDCEIRFATPRSRIGVLSVEINGVRHAQNLRLDVLDQAWVG